MFDILSTKFHYNQRVQTKPFNYGLTLFPSQMFFLNALFQDLKGSTTFRYMQSVFKCHDESL